MTVLGVAKKTKNPATLNPETWAKAIGVHDLEKQFLDGKITQKEYERRRRKGRR